MTTITRPIRSDTRRSTLHEGSGGRTHTLSISHPEKFADTVARLATQTIGESLYPSINYYNLSRYLKDGQARQEASVPGFGWPNAAVQDDFSYVTTHSICNQGVGVFQYIRSVEELKDERTSSAPDSISSRVIFMRGLPSPLWLNSIGAQYSVYPEFYVRHLDFHAQAGRPDYFTLPSLPSGMNSIICVSFTTIGYLTKGDFESHISLQSFRQSSSRQMEKYLGALRKDKWSLGDSLVREFDIHDKNHWSLEQRISLWVTRSGGGWTGIAWTDSGRPLDYSGNRNGHERGPWTSIIGNSEIFPVILQSTSQSSRSNKLSTDIKNSYGAFQSSFLLHQHMYNFKGLDSAVGTVDAFYAFSEIFSFAAASELQFLNMLGDIIGREMHPSTLLHQDDPSISNLLYSHVVLERHIQQISGTISAIENRKSSNWPKALNASDVEIVDARAASLLADFHYLLAKARDLSARCDKGMTITMNNASIQESKRAVWQAETTTKLTRLAFVFIPLSYTASFFGMNFKELSGSPLHSLWIYPAASAPVMLISYLVLQVNFTEIWRKWSRKRAM